MLYINHLKELFKKDTEIKNNITVAVGDDVSSSTLFVPANATNIGIIIKWEDLEELENNYAYRLYENETLIEQGIIEIATETGSVTYQGKAGCYYRFEFVNGDAGTIAIGAEMAISYNQAYFNYEDEEVIITDEINYHYNGEGLAIQIKYLSGNNFKDNMLIPIQLAIWTRDIENDRLFLESWAKANNNRFYTKDFKTTKEIYSTPMVLGSFQAIGNNYSSQIIISGFLIISDANVCDIAQVFIDGIEYETTSRVLSYITRPNTVKDGLSNSINVTAIENATIKFDCSMISKSNALTTKIRRVKNAGLSLDSSFTIKLVYSDGYIENYAMKLASTQINSENTILPTTSLEFIK